MRGVECGHNRDVERLRGAGQAVEDAAQARPDPRRSPAGEPSPPRNSLGHVIAVEQLGPHRALAMELQLVDDRVAGDVDPGGVDALADQRVAGLGCGRKQPIGKVIREHAVHLFGHAAVIRAEARLDVTDLDPALVRRQRRGEHGVRVTLDQQNVGGSLVRIGSRPETMAAIWYACDPEPTSRCVVRGRQAQLLEEHAVELEGVVLAGVEQPVGDAAGDRGAHHGRHLDDLGPCADDDRGSSRWPPSCVFVDPIRASIREGV